MHALVWGPPGKGKTRFAATFPGPVRYLLCSAGNIPSNELRSVNTPEYRSKLRPVYLKSTKQLEEEVAEVRQGKHADCQTLVLDYAAGLQDIILMEDQGWAEIRAQVSVLEINQKKENQGKAIWGRVADRFKECERMLFNLRKHVVLVGHSRTFTPDQMSRKGYIEPWQGIDLTPGISSNLHRNADYSWYFDCRQKMIEGPPITVGSVVERNLTPVPGAYEYYMQVGPCPPLEVKTRVTAEDEARLPGGKLPDVVIDPTYAKIQAVIAGQVL